MTLHLRLQVFIWNDMNKFGRKLLGDTATVFGNPSNTEYPRAALRLKPHYLNLKMQGSCYEFLLRITVQVA